MVKSALHLVCVLGNLHEGCSSNKRSLKRSMSKWLKLEHWCWPFFFSNSTFTCHMSHVAFHMTCYLFFSVFFCIGATIRTRQFIQCLLYAGFFVEIVPQKKNNYLYFFVQPDLLRTFILLFFQYYYYSHLLWKGKNSMACFIHFFYLLTW